MTWRTRRGDHSSRSRIALGLKQPTRGSQGLALSSGAHTGRASPPLLFGLAPRGVFRAPDVTIQAVGSYPTFSPLPKCARPRQGKLRFSGAPAVEEQAALAVYFLWHYPSSRPQGLLSPTLERNSLALPGALPFRRRLLRVRDEWSPDFPPVRSLPPKRTGDHPTHPPLSSIRRHRQRHNRTSVRFISGIRERSAIKTRNPG